MSSLTCFPNKSVKPGRGVPGNEVVDECGKRLSDSVWASEDLSGGSEVGRDVSASRGSPERSPVVDSQRAISLDASECLTEISNLALVRSTALEDLTSIGDRRVCAHQAEELIREQTSDDLPLNNMTQEQQPLPSRDPRPALGCLNVSMPDSLSPVMSCEKGSGDSSMPRWAACDSQPDISNGSDVRSLAGELQKTPSPARKSLVPVAIPKGLFAVTFTSSEPPQLTPPTSLVYKWLHSPSEVLLSAPGEACCSPSPL